MMGMLTAQQRRLPVRTRTRNRSRSVGAPLRGLIPIIVGLLIWQLLAPPTALVFPPPSEWVSALAEMQSEGSLLSAVGQTLMTLLLGLACAILVGVSIGMLVGSSRVASRALEPLLDFFRALPPPVVVPLIAVVLGATLGGSVAIVVFGSVWPIMLSTTAAMQAVPTVRRDASRTFGLSPLARFRKVYLPSITPGAMVGIRVSASIALLVTVFGEMLGVGDGLGALLADHRAQFDSAGVWGLMIVLGIGGYLLNLAVIAIDTRVLRQWPS